MWSNYDSHYFLFWKKKFRAVDRIIKQTMSEADMKILR